MPGTITYSLQCRTPWNTPPPAKSKMATRGHKIAERVWKEVQPYFIEPSDQLLLNKFSDSIIPSMRASKIQKGHQRALKWLTGSWKEFTPKFLGTPINFRKKKSFD